MHCMRSHNKQKNSVHTIALVENRGAALSNARFHLIIAEFSVEITRWIGVRRTQKEF